MNMLANPDLLYWGLPIVLLVGTTAAAVLAFHPGKQVRHLAHWPCILCIAVALCFSVVLAGVVLRRPEGVVLVPGYGFINVGYLQISLGLYLDSLAAVMLLLVNGISLLVAIYSVGYMHDDEGYGRYFAIIGLFVFSMNMLVIVDNYLALYIFWEGVGLCSYLLIGHWYEKPSASQAARKAFLVNRIGDMSLLLGILLIWHHLGMLRYGAVFSLAAGLTVPAVTLICFLLLVGACAKSAQFPLHVWLPDAMEGPTPVSALIHAATMVTAGVYLIARNSFLFVLSPVAQLAVLSVGMLTALLGACIAATQFDLKRVLAYSTISQLGLMFTSLGAAAFDRALLPYAASAAILHLVTHGFFKALLFLTAGNVMHSTNGVMDMRMLGGLRRALPYTHLTFAVGALALAAIPPFAGFYSKDAILAILLRASSESSQGLATWFVAGFLLTGLLTAFYISRAYFLTFWGREHLSTEDMARLHESPSTMLVPVFLLAGASLVGGMLLEVTNYFERFIHISSPFGEIEGEDKHQGFALAIGLSVLLSLGGIGIAVWRYLWQGGEGEVPPLILRPLYILSAGKFFLDEIYYLLVVRPAEIVGQLAGWMDRILDGLVDLVGWAMWLLGKVFRPMQNGQVQFYALAIVLALAVFCLVLLRRAGI